MHPCVVVSASPERSLRIQPPLHTVYLSCGFSFASFPMSRRTAIDVSVLPALFCLTVPQASLISEAHQIIHTFLDTASGLPDLCSDGPMMRAFPVDPAAANAVPSPDDVSSALRLYRCWSGARASCVVVVPVRCGRVSNLPAEAHKAV